MTARKPPIAGVGIPALIGTLLLAAVLSGVLGAVAFSAIMMALDPSTAGETVADTAKVMLVSGLFIGIFAIPFILVPLAVAGIPMAVAFTRLNLTYPLRYLWSGMAAALLGSLMGAGMWQGDAYGFLIGGSFALLSAWVWLTLLRRFDRSRLSNSPHLDSAPVASA